MTWWNGGDPRPQAPVETAAAPAQLALWNSPEWQRWESRAHGLSLARPASWMPDEVPERLTERSVGELRATVVAGFRGEHPVVIYRYRAPAARPWREWSARLDRDAALRDEFGAELLARRTIAVSGQAGLLVDGRGAVRKRLWRFRSLYFARGDTAFRVTVGADQRHWPALAASFDRLLRSVAWQPSE